MSSKENSASGFSDWHEVISALDTEIIASQEKKTDRNGTKRPTTQRNDDKM